MRERLRPSRTQMTTGQTLLTDYRGHSAEGGAETIQDKPHETCHPAFGRDSSEIAFTVLSPMLYYSESLQRFFTEFHVCERFKPTDNSEGAPTSPERPFVFHAKAAGMLKF